MDGYESIVRKISITRLSNKYCSWENEARSKKTEMSQFVKHKLWLPLLS